MWISGNSRVVGWIAAVLGGAAVALSCSDSAVEPTPTPEPVASVAIQLPTDAILMGDSLKLSATLTCQHGHVLSRAVTWSSTKPGVAAVSEKGMVQAKRPGTVVLSAVSEGIRGTATLTVMVPAANVAVAPTVDTLLPGETVQIQAIVTDSLGNSLDRPITWKSRNSAIATVNTDGVVTAVGPGTTQIVARHLGLVATTKIVVRSPVATAIVTPAVSTIIIPNTVRLSATLRDAFGAALNRPVTWTSSDPTIAVVDATGLVTPVARGVAAITATSEGRIGTAAVTVKAAVNAVTIEPAVAVVDVGEQIPLAAVLLDEEGNALNRAVAWASEAPSVASVDDGGIITGRVPGTTAITATIEGKSATSAVTVLEPVATLELSASATTLDIGQSFQLSAVPRDARGNALNRPVSWTSSNTRVASIDAGGYVLAVGEGTATIEATSRGQTASVTIISLVPVASVSLDPPGATLAPGTTLQVNAVVRDAAGNALVRDVAWASSNPAIASVDASGSLTALAPGTVTLTATARGRSAQGYYTVQKPVAGVTLNVSDLTLSVGASAQLTATPTAEDGELLDRPVAWATSNGAVATVDASGFVRGIGAGIASITAESEGKRGIVTVVVRIPVAGVAVTAPGGEPLSVGGTVQLTVSVTDATGKALTDRVVTWTTGDDAIATVDEAGLVTATGRGTVVITATSEGVSGTAEIRVVGESVGTLGNNLSYPVIFSEGIGLTGLPVSEDAGLRPTSTEGITVDVLPFFASTNAPDYDQYFLQQGVNVWQAEWRDGSSLGSQAAEVKWGDNLTHQAWTTHSVIRIEVGLYAYQQAPLTGFEMSYVYGDGQTEMQGTDGTTIDSVPTIYAVTPRLVIQKLDDVTREPIFTLFNGAIHDGFGTDGPGAFSAEVNVAGKVVYGYNLQLQNATVPADIHKYGWWRITFALDESGGVGGVTIPRNTTLDRLVASTETLTFTPQIDAPNNVSWIDINVTSSRSGGGGGEGEL